ncbi:MAG: hypothetical protein K5929_06005 [Lachnospiraceae bacterium]|nr:hypothetical protein [Lachnospiraceae bacterium]
MAEKDQHSPVIGTTTAYRKQMITMIIAGVAVIAVVLCVVFFWFGIKAKARTTLREAKDIRIAMKMKAIEKYGFGGAVYNPSAVNGMSQGIEEEILKMADADGQIILQAWDKEAREPSAFTYQKDRYIVLFNKSDSGAISWTGYYTFKLIEFSDQ